MSESHDLYEYAVLLGDKVIPCVNEKMARMEAEDQAEEHGYAQLAERWVHVEVHPWCLLEEFPAAPPQEGGSDGE